MPVVRYIGWNYRGRDRESIQSTAPTVPCITVQARPNDLADWRCPRASPQKTMRRGRPGSPGIVVVCRGWILWLVTYNRSSCSVFFQPKIGMGCLVKWYRNSVELWHTDSTTLTQWCLVSTSKYSKIEFIEISQAGTSRRHLLYLKLRLYIDMQCT